MVDFSVILQDPTVRSVVQDGILERSFYDALFPNLMFRGECTRVKFAGGIGDTITFTGAGLIKTDGTPIRPGQDPDTASYGVEHWAATPQQYGKSIPTHMPSSAVAIADLFKRNSHQIGLNGGQTLDKEVRNRMYGAAISGWTNSTGSNTGSVVPVARLNGLTRAYNSTTGTFDPVSATNPLSIVIKDNNVATANTIVAYTSDDGTETGPGKITLGSAPTSIASRAYIYSVDRSNMVIAGGGSSIDDLIATDLPTLANVRTVVSTMRTSSVPVHPDGRYHIHLDPTSEGDMYADTEFRILNTALPDYFIYRDFAISDMLGCVWLRNAMCPTTDTVNGGSTNAWDTTDKFPGELWTAGSTTTGIPVHRMLVTGQGGIMEYYLPFDLLLTDAGITGQIAEPSITNNGIEIYCEGIQMAIRAPLNLFQDMVNTTWKFIGDWAIRTDYLAVGSQRFKRFGCIVHG